MNYTASIHFPVSRWIKATSGGWLLGVALLIMLSSLLDSVGIEQMQFYLGVGMGAGVGFTQWLVLRKVIRMGAGWIWFSVLGMSIPFIAADFLFTEASVYKLPLSVAAGAVIAGALQILPLRKHSDKAALWIGGSFIGWALATVTVFMVNYTMKIKVAGSWNLAMAGLNLLLILSGGVILGIITGFTLRKIFKTGN